MGKASKGRGVGTAKPRVEAERKVSVGRYYWGIDGGLTGGVGIIGKGEAKVFDLKIFRVHSKGYVDTLELNRLATEYPPCLVVIELAGVMRKQGLASSAQTMLVYGMLISWALTRGYTFEIVASAKWKRRLGLIGMDKEASRAKALKWFPRLKDALKRKMDHNRAEGLLLAEYGRSYT